ncbi:MAG: MMPL family transporter [Methylobacteriaceae bacterium]|nr:MMPL family transporter [Methylobacteriaceae bacterium]
MEQGIKDRRPPPVRQNRPEGRQTSAPSSLPALPEPPIRESRPRLNSVILRSIEFCTRRAWVVILVAVALATASCLYVGRHFAISTNLDNLISPDLAWRQRELAYESAFPQTYQLILGVVRAPTPELASAGAHALAEQLSQKSELFRSIEELGGGPFFQRNGLLFLSTQELKTDMDRLSGAFTLIGVLAADPSLRGLTQALSLGLDGIEKKQFSLDDMSRPLNEVAATLEDVLAGRPASFSWKVLMNGRPATPDDLRRLVSVWPKLDFSALQPGQAATTAVRAAGERAELASDFKADLRLTGPVPISDEEFATLQEGALTNGLITAAIVLTILWLALRSVKIVFAVSVTLAAGLATTAALGLLMVGALNPISVAFAVLFVGLGADFAIQFSVRYRAERHGQNDLQKALAFAAQRVGAPLTLAAAAAAAGFLSFLPTSYTGLAELGLIAGCGMGVAYLASMTLLPALLEILSPPPEPEPLGYEALAPIDHFLTRHRLAVVAATAVIALAGLPLLLHLRFDFNPLDLRNPSEESVATYRELLQNPLISANTAEVLARSPDEADALAKKLAGVPEVAQTRTIDSFVPAEQNEKRGIIASTADALLQALDPADKATPPTDAENIAALKSAADDLNRVAGTGSGPGPEASKRLAGDLVKLSEAAPDVRAKAQGVMVQPLTWDLDELRQALQPEQVTRANLPAALARDWIAPDGRARVEATPKGDANDDATVRRFADAVLAAEPSATGSAIGTSEWGQTIIHAFLMAAVWALCSIAVLLWIVLRRVTDVLLTLVPLIVAAVVTLEICALTDFPLNYANIIALPVLLGVGVAFKIYYVMAWRAGQTNFLQSPLTRAVFFSALMTATAFGSLWFSSHPGTSSMGKLLALSLACTLASAALFQPALMGQPRQAK